MSTYIVGDIHGCFDELQALLTLASFNAEIDQLIFTGDLVARGHKSLETLRFIKNLGHSAKMVLGNHDLHLLAIHQNITKAKPKDHLDTLLAAPDCDELLTWLRHQPLLLQEEDFAVVHAGILSEWSIDQAASLAKEVESQLQSTNFKVLLAEMYSNTPTTWSEQLQGIPRLRFIINVFTRMRYRFNDGALEFKNKLPPQKNQKDMKPWFDFKRPDKHIKILFGHWAALVGKVEQEDIYGLDTGCVWGNSLSMLRWQDKKMFSLPCPIEKASIKK